jgi:hypothetical protein
VELFQSFVARGGDDEAIKEHKEESPKNTLQPMKKSQELANAWRKVLFAPLRVSSLSPSHPFIGTWNL